MSGINVNELVSGAREHLRRRAEFYWAPLLYLLAVCLLYREVLAGEKGFGWDTIESYWPDLVYFSDQLGRGEWPNWNPYDRGGYPFSADPQTGVFYPVHWLLSCVGIALGDISWTMIQFKMLLHHAIAGLCMHAFLRHRNLPRTAAAVGGVALIASSPWLIHKASNLLMPMVWTPLVWIAIDRLVDKPSWRRGAALAAALYLPGTAGSPPGFFYVLVMAGAYGAFRFLTAVVPKIRERKLQPYATRFAVAITIAAILVFCLLWISVAPGLDLSEHTPRAKRGLAYALSVPLPMLPTLKALLVPTAGHVDAYCGILVTMLALTAVLLRPMQDRGMPIFLLLAASFFLLLSFGNQTPLLPWLARNVPGFGMFRVSSRYKCLFAPMMAALAGYGAANLLLASRRFSRDTWKTLLLVVASLALVLFLLHDNPMDLRKAKRFPHAPVSITLSLLGAGLILGSVLHKRRSATFLIAAMPLLIVGDPARYWHHTGPFLEKRVDHQEDRTKIAALDGVDDHRYRIYDEYQLEQRPGSRLQIRDFHGYPSGDPLEFRRYQDILKKATKNPELLEAFNVRYVLQGRHHRSGKRTNRLKQNLTRVSSAHFKKGPNRSSESRHPVAIAQWYAGAVIKKPAEVLDTVIASEDEQGLRRYAVLEERSRTELGPALEQLLAVGTDGPASITGTLQAMEADRVSISITAPATGLVVLNELQYPGWHAYLNGDRVPTTTVNYLLRGVIVPKGQHSIEWRFEPARWGLFSLYILALLVLAAAFLTRKARASQLLCASLE